jgi:hypothetical protein
MPRILNDLHVPPPCLFQTHLLTYIPPLNKTCCSAAGRSIEKNDELRGSLERDVEIVREWSKTNDRLGSPLPPKKLTCQVVLISRSSSISLSSLSISIVSLSSPLNYTMGESTANTTSLKFGKWSRSHQFPQAHSYILVPALSPIAEALCSFSSFQLSWISVIFLCVWTLSAQELRTTVYYHHGHPECRAGYLCRPADQLRTLLEWHLKWGNHGQYGLVEVIIEFN